MFGKESIAAGRGQFNARAQRMSMGATANAYMLMYRLVEENQILDGDSKGTRDHLLVAEEEISEEIRKDV